MRLLCAALFFSLGLTIGSAVSDLGGRSPGHGGDRTVVDETANAPATADRSGAAPSADVPLQPAREPERCASATPACVAQSQQVRG